MGVGVTQNGEIPEREHYKQSVKNEPKKYRQFITVNFAAEVTWEMGGEKKGKLVAAVKTTSNWDSNEYDLSWMKRLF
jgi:hypothetical protein